MRRSWPNMIGSFLLAGAAAFAANANMNQAHPGALNYVEGQASIGSQVVDSKSVGSATLEPGQILATQSGKAEILLTPGVFLRVDNNSSIRMDSAGLADTQLTLEQGRAMVEVGDIRKENDIVIHEANASARLLKKGLYDFNAATNEVRVFDGKAEVMVDDRKIDVGGGHMLALNDPKLKPEGFDKKKSEDEFYRWAKLRSSYLAEANVDAARIYYAGGPGWYGPGWYWDPWYSAYTWIPGAGVLWSPFGWGFYSPFTVITAPVIVGPRHFVPVHRGPVIIDRGGFHGGVNTFHGSAPHGFAHRGGGFRGGGGFHGGGGHR